MKKIDLGQTIQIFANIGVLAGIVFLTFELKEMSRATQLAAAESHTARANEIDRLFFENPDLLRREDVNPQDPDSMRRAGQRLYLSRMQLRVWQTAYYQYSLNALDARLFQLFEKEVQIALRLDDTLVEYWKDFGASFYGPEFAEFIDAQIAESQGVLGFPTATSAN